MRFRPWMAATLVAACLLTGCAGAPDAPEQTTITATAPSTEEPETVATIATVPTTLPPATPPEEVLPEIETLVSDTPNARVYIDGGTLCVDTCDEVTTGTGSIAYDQIDGGIEAWQSVVAKNVALCALIRTTMDDVGAYASPAKVTVLDHRFESRPILTIVDGDVVEDTVAIELATAKPKHPDTGHVSDSGSPAATVTYILNTNSHVFHRPGCGSVKQMKDENKQAFSGSRDDAIAMGYKPCGNCNP